MISVPFWRLVLGLAFAAVPANAAATPSDVATFGYRAPPECPTRVDFSARVAARTAGWLSPTSPFAVTVAIERNAQQLVAQVTFARGEQRTVRELQAAGCNELVQALAFIVAVLIDPQASTTPLPAPGEGRPPPVYLLPAAPSLPRLPAALWLIVGPELAIETAPTLAAGVAERFFLGIGRGDGSLAMSSARLSFSRAVTHASSPISGARAEFVLETARLEGCLLRVSDAGLAFEPCPFVELGRLRAVGIHSGGNVTRSQPWGSLGLVLRPTWTFARRLVLGAGLGVQLPLGRYRFAFTGEPELTRNPQVSFEATLSLGVRFP